MEILLRLPNVLKGSLMLSVLFLLSACASMDVPNSPAAESSQEAAPVMQDTPERLQVLFLGDNGHHRPADRIQQLIPVLASQGIYIHYTDRQDEIRPENLNNYDVFMMYGNRTGLPQDQETAILNFVNEGGGFVAIHSASATFNDSDAFVNLVGGAFKSHGVGTFRTNRTEPNHPVFQGVPQIESWDETYVHMKLNPDMTVLSVREEGSHQEPWTWVRNQGDGRVFYTAWGHDARTWGNEGFQKLVERGIRWSAGDWALDMDFSPPALTYGEGLLPNYPAGEPWGTTAEPITDVQEPLSPEESREHIMLDPAFSVELFASEPDIVNPIDMAWDEKGRLWIVETVDYPNKFLDGRVGNDRIKILEDTNGDGRADTFTVFAEGLNIPTSLVLYDGGVIVAQAPDFLYLKDTTGDGKADHKEVLFTGWGTFDTHAGPSNLHYGFDNQIWGVTGYSAFNGTVGGEELQFSSGIYRFMPDGSKLEQISRTTNNTWGFGFSEEGLVFGSTANNDVPVYSAVPNRYYRSVRGPLVGQSQQRPTPAIPRIAQDNSIYPITEGVRQVDQHGRYTAGSGFHLYTARNFPKHYWNRRAFIGEPTAHLLGEFVIEPNGSTFTADNVWNFMASQDEWFSPIQTKVGPDGALWMIDWYNLVIQHNPFPDGWERGEGNAYVTDHRDVNHARIYRVVYNGEEDSYQAFNLDGASPSELVDALTHDNLFWRQTAQRLLVERGETDVAPALLELLMDQSIDELGLNPGALHALWTLDGLGLLDGSNSSALRAVYTALHHPAASVRRAALMTIPRNEESLRRILAADFVPNTDVPGAMNYTMPASSMMAANPQVRLSALLALSEMPVSEQAGAAVAEVLVLSQTANDRWMRDAAISAAANHEESFLTHVLTKTLPQQADSTYKANVENAIYQVARHFAMGDLNGSVYDYLSQLDGVDEAIGIGLVRGVAAGWPEESAPAFNMQQQQSLRTLIANLPDSYEESLTELEEKWSDTGLF